MSSHPDNTRSTRDNITLYLFWFRLATIGLVVVLALTGIKHVPLATLSLALLYNAVVFAYRGRITGCVRARPYLLLVDLAFGYYLMFTTGGFKSPYYLYGFSAIVIGSFVFGYPGAIVLASLQSSIFFAAVHSGGYTIADIIDSGEHLVTDFFFYFLVGLSSAYLSNLLYDLDTAQLKQLDARTRLVTATEKLSGFLKSGDLSEREREVLLLALEGKKVDEISGTLRISASSVKTYLSRSYKKLGVVSREDAILKLVTHGHEAI